MVFMHVWRACDLGTPCALCKEGCGKEVIQGMVHALEITKDTKLEGEIRVGAKVAVEAEGKTAQTVKASVGG